MGRKVSSGERCSGKHFSWRDRRTHLSCISSFFLLSFFLCTWGILFFHVFPLSPTAAPALPRASSFFFVQSAANPAEASSSQAASSPFSAAYLAEVKEMEEMEAQKRSGASSVEDGDVPISEEEEARRGNSEWTASPPPNIVQKRFWGPKNDRVEDIPFVLSSSTFKKTSSSKAYRRSPLDDGEEEEEEEDDGDAEDVEVREPDIIFPTLFGTSFLIDADPFDDDSFPMGMEDAPRPPPRAGGSVARRRGGGGSRQVAVSQEEMERRINASQRIQLKVEKKRARQKPHEEGCYLVAMDLLHRVRRVRPVVEKGYTDALGRYNELQYNYSALVKTIQHDKKKKPPPSSSSSSGHADPTAEAPPIALQQAEVTLRHARHQFEAAAEEWKEFNARTWTGLSWRVANRCLAEAARYRYYLLHRELSSMTLASLPPPDMALYHDDDDFDDKEDDEEDTMEEEKEEVESEEGGKKNALVYSDAEIEETPEMETERKAFRVKYRQWYKEAREKRAKNKPANRTMTKEEEEEEKEKEIKKDEEEIETLMETKYKPFILSQARERIEADLKNRQRKEEEERKQQKERRKRNRRSAARRRKGGRAWINEEEVSRTSRSRKTLQLDIRVRNTKPEDYMTFSQVMLQCKNFARNSVYGLFIPPFYILRQLTAAVVDFYWEEFWMTPDLRGGADGKGGEGMRFKTTTLLPEEGVPRGWGSLVSRLPQWGVTQLETWRVHIRKMRGGRNLGEKGKEMGTASPLPTSTEAHSPSAEQEDVLAEKSVFWLQVWVLGIAGGVVCFLLAPFVLLVLFFRELFFQLVFCPFFLQYLLRMQSNPFSLWKDMVVVHLLQHRQPHDALAAFLAWRTSVQTRFQAQGGFGRWWKQTEAFLCVTTVLAILPIAWLVWKGCWMWCRVVYFGWRGSGGRKKGEKYHENKGTTLQTETMKEMTEEETDETESEEEEPKKDR